MNITNSTAGSGGGGAMDATALSLFIVAAIIGFCVCCVLPCVWRRVKEVAQKKRTILDVTY